jgi:hypothetical protein
MLSAIAFCCSFLPLGIGSGLAETAFYFTPLLFPGKPLFLFNPMWLTFFLFEFCFAFSGENFSLLSFTLSAKLNSYQHLEFVLCPWFFILCG